MAANTDKVTDFQQAPKAVVEGNPPSNQTNKQEKQSLHPKRSSVIKIVLGVALVAIVLLFGWHIYSNRSVVIGNTTITAKEVNELSDEISQYTKNNKHVSFGGPPHKVARDDLILNAALKNEASKYHVSVTQADVDAVQANQYQAYGSKFGYIRFVQEEGITQLTRVTSENDAYKAKLENKIIAKKDLFVAAIIYDTPYVNNSTNPTPTALRQQAFQTMQNKFLPLFQQGKSTADIAAQANINSQKHVTQGASGPYFNSMPSVAFSAKGCTTTTPCFHDVESKPVAGLPAPVSTQSEINQLTKVGQTTGVFNSEAGFVGIIELTGKTSGSYNSWGQFLQSYEKKYATGKLLAVNLLPANKIALALGKLSHQLSILGIKPGSFLLPKASADATDCSQNSSHFVQLDIHAYNQSGGNLSGATVTETRPNANCPNSGGRYIDSQGGPNHGPNGGSTDSSGQLSFNDNCYNSPPDWTQSGPSGNSLSWVHVHDTLGDDSTMIVGGNFNGPINEDNAIGKAVADSGIWSNGTLNIAGTLTVELHYKATPPTTWSLNGSTTVDGSSGTITKQPGATVTFSHTVHNNGPSTASYSWQVKDSTGGSYSGNGLPGSGGGIGVGNNNNGPDGLTKNYTIPGNAQNGDKYCQRIDYTNANGLNTATQNSTPACVVVNKSPPTTQSYGCSETNIDVPHVNGYQTWITLSGTDSDQGGGGYYVPQVGSNIKLDLHYTALAQDVTVTTHNYHWQGSPASWVEVSTTPLTFHCYHASCNPAVTGQGLSVKGNGPGGIVLAGQPFTVYVPVKNDNTNPSAETIPASAAGYPFSLTESADDYQGGVAGHGAGFSLTPGETETAGIPFNANGNTGNIRTMTLNFYPDFYGYGSLGEGCSVTFTIYQQFSATVSAQSDPAPTIENPSSDTYGATITHAWVNPPAGLPSHAINNPVSTSFYQKKANGSQTTPCSPSSYSSSGPYNVPSPSPPGHDTIWSNNCAIAPGSFTAGDEFCSTVTATYGSGYVGPDNNVVFGGPSKSDIKCPRVVNEPYFKVYNSDISAGGDFDKCTTNGGTLAGYADIGDGTLSNPSGATRGSSTQLSALSISTLINIKGVASAQSPGNITRSPTDLTFANTGVQVDSSGTENPMLGGMFGGCSTLTNETAPASATAAKNTGSNPVINDVSTLTPPPGPANTPNAHVYDNGTNNTPGTTKLTIKGGTLAANQNVSVFVNGDAYISNDITYGSGWQVGTAPSFILHATGNIYIAPGVKQLAGIYLAQSNSAGAGGKIYTCADPTGFAPMSAGNLYNGCKNQLVVFGSFVADQVNLMRTPGSLRDETPITKTVTTPNNDGAVELTRMNCGGSPEPGVHFYQAQSSPKLPTNVPSGCSKETGHPNAGFVLPTQISGSVPLYYAQSSSNGDNVYTTDQSTANGVCGGGNKKDGNQHNNCAVTVGYVQTQATLCGAPQGKDKGGCNVTPAMQSAAGVEPLYGVSVNGYHFYTTDATEYAGVKADFPPAKDKNDKSNLQDLGIVAYVYAAAGAGGTSSTTILPVGTPNPLVCSNLGSQTVTSTCAGEVFEFSPALYLPNGGGTTCPSGGCGGPLQPLSITSLPPVL